MTRSLSWGRFPRHAQSVHAPHWPDDVPAALTQARQNAIGTSLPFGMGRSYGDSCLAASDHVLSTIGMDRVISVNWETGVVVAQAGLTLAALIALALPRGWFPPVTPGTKFVTLGGAVANDVHGKNHHLVGTFGRHVRRLHLFRSDEGSVECAPELRPELFAATVGGLGLTGIILQVEIQLRTVRSNLIDQRSVRFGNLDEFFALTAEHDQTHEYTVAWIDCLAKGTQMGRGHFLAGKHSPEGALSPAPERRMRIPIDPPFSLVNGMSLRAFNTLYFHRQQQRSVDRVVGYEPFFYPLDSIRHWNRIYGQQGFQQYQCVVPESDGKQVIRAVLTEIARRGMGSFLAVLKQCGGLPSPGLLSFPLAGYSLALDFPEKGQANVQLFAALDALVHEAGGRLYPAKDAHMSGAHFRKAFPAWERVEDLRDPGLLSRFWKRVTQCV